MRLITSAFLSRFGTSVRQLLASVPPVHQMKLSAEVVPTFSHERDENHEEFWGIKCQPEHSSCPPNFYGQSETSWDFQVPYIILRPTPTKVFHKERSEVQKEGNHVVHCDQMNFIFEPRCETTLCTKENLCECDKNFQKCQPKFTGDGVVMTQENGINAHLHQSSYLYLLSTSLVLGVSQHKKRAIQTLTILLELSVDNW